MVMKNICTLMVVVAVVAGHGRLREPPSRSSMWRDGYNTPKNYNDNQLYCGGFQNQQNHGGKCGICGDPFQGPRENEAGGKYATGVITRSYNEGDVIEVKVEITANHEGWFEFRVCPNNDITRPASQACLNSYLLHQADGSGTRYQLGSSQGFITYNLKLPEGLTCSQCVLQWKYHTGNRWDDGCTGCGAQEFYGCSDIDISSSRPPTPGTHSPTRQPTTPRQTQEPPIIDERHHHRRLVCKSAGAWKGQLGMDGWCQENCSRGYCPATHCKCHHVWELPHKGGR
eukprot:GHVU01051336.1.p1 GENE.GHVU01051336.1~~GHVU01051336.1.p1  ORF type:complete len:285 (-),score=6.29 GHVU01051336.1:129-983(-)